MRSEIDCCHVCQKEGSVRESTKADQGATSKDEKIKEFRKSRQKQIMERQVRMRK